MFDYDNIGKKIQTWAMMVFAVEAIAAVIAGIVVIAVNIAFVVIGLPLIIFGPFVAWVSSWILYGFGRLIENSDVLADERRRKMDAQEKARISKELENAKRAAELQKKAEDDIYVDFTCPCCKEKLSFPKENVLAGSVTCPECDTVIKF